MKSTKRSLSVAVLTIFVAIFIISFTSCKEIHPFCDPLQSFYYHEILRVSDDALFRANGEVNLTVLGNLIQILSDERLDPMLRPPKTHWPSGHTFTGAEHRVVTAQDFSSFVVQEPSHRDHSGAIVMRLFEPVARRRGVRNAHLTELSNAWWQLVYRTTDDGRDVLTLWMFEPYRLSRFNGNRFDALRENRIDEIFQSTSQILKSNINVFHTDHSQINRSAAPNNFFYEGNYSNSIVRENLIRDTDSLFGRFKNAERFFVAPRDLPANWQSAYFQTSRNGQGEFYRSGSFLTVSVAEWRGTGSQNIFDGLGASGRISAATHNTFAIGNGMDGKNVGPFGENNTDNLWRHGPIRCALGDLMWLPSYFEIRSMGHDRDDATFTTFIAPQDTDNINARLSSNRGETHGTGRSGLWRLNAFDRSYLAANLGSDRAWTRNGDTRAIGNAVTGCSRGNRYTIGVTRAEAVRPATHISLSCLWALVF